MKKTNTLIWLLLLLFAITAAPTDKANPAATRDLLIGQWRCKIEYGYWTIHRRANGKFEKNGKIVRAIGKTPESFSVKGRWRLEGKQYIEIWDEVLPPSWSKLTGSVRRAEVLLLEREKFRRIQEDSPVFTETRIKQISASK